MKRKCFLLGLFLILVIFLVGCLPPVNVKVSGTVYYSTTPVPNVMVELVSGDATDPAVFSTTTTTSGAFTFFDVPSGDYWLKAYGPTEEYIGWRARSITVGSIDLISDIYLCKKMTLLSPPQNSVVNISSPTFCWQGLPEAVVYTFQLNRSSDWKLIDFVHNIQPTCYTTLQKLQNGVEYSWQIDAIDKNGHDVGTTETAFQFNVKEGLKK